MDGIFKMARQNFTYVQPGNAGNLDFGYKTTKSEVKIVNTDSAIK